jgi:hypothetical protein
VKFLYCEVCRDAVGKRVFRNQHHHLDDGLAPSTTPAHHDSHALPNLLQMNQNVSDSDISHLVGGTGIGLPGVEQRPRDNSMEQALLRGVQHAQGSDTTGLGGQGRTASNFDVPSSNVLSQSDGKPARSQIPCRARGMPQDHDFKVRHDFGILTLFEFILVPVILL